LDHTSKGRKDCDTLLLTHLLTELRAY